MIMPENKLCPMSFNNSLFNGNACPCLGELCMWFDKENGACLGANPAVVKAVQEIVEPATKARATSRKKESALAQ